jgi:hypothetical protein
VVALIHQHILTVSLSIINEVATSAAIDITAVFMNQNKV